MTAPDMVSVIAAAIVAHLEHHGDEYDLDYSAGCLNMGADLAPLVLAAITEAGAVEYAVRDAEGIYPPGPASTDPADVAEMRRDIKDAGDMGIEMIVVSRFTFPWERAE